MRINIPKLKKEQYKLAKKIRIKNEFEKIELVAGVDQAFVDNKVISAIVVLNKNMKLVERKYAIVETQIPYIPGFMSYRESPAIVEAYNKLENKPDILIIDAHGILHPRKIGMASHVGILLETPTIGVAKGLIIGDVKEDGKVYVDDEVRGQKIITKEHAKPLFVSPGHRVTLTKAVEIVKSCVIPPHKLPEPLHLAHRFADKVREDLVVKEKKEKETSIEDNAETKKLQDK